MKKNDSRMEQGSKEDEEGKEGPYGGIKGTRNEKEGRGRHGGKEKGRIKREGK